MEQTIEMKMILIKMILINNINNNKYSNEINNDNDIIKKKNTRNNYNVID